jgi:hypothetical protein
MSSNTLTDNDRKLLAAAWQCFETQPKVRNHFPHTETKTILKSN